ncbi:hypothetical protein ACFLVY_02010 [Chloroflexota bacterium]
MTVENINSEALEWLRNSLLNTLEIAPLSDKPKKATRRALRRVPDWILMAWANALNINYVNTSEASPEFPKRVNSLSGRYHAQRYLEARDAVAAGNCLQQLAKSVLRLTRGHMLPVAKEIVERGVCALALAPLTTEGMEFAERANAILTDRYNNHVIVNYHFALEGGERNKLEAVDALLTESGYGKWVADRLTEAKRWFGLEPPHFNINCEERNPQWDNLWGNIIKGDSHERENSGDMGTC